MKRNDKTLLAVGLSAGLLVGVSATLVAQQDALDASELANMDLDTATLSPDKPLSQTGEDAMRAVARQQAEPSYVAASGGYGVSYLFGSGLPELVCAPRHVCLIELERGERVLPGGINIGDGHRWNVQPLAATGDTTHLVLKPIDAGLATNMAVQTDRRTYHVRLVSRRQDYMPLLRFTYPDRAIEIESHAEWSEYHANSRAFGDFAGTPETPAAPVAPPAVSRMPAGRMPAVPPAKSASDMDFGYSVSCNRNRCPFMPARVYNDGERTIIDLPNDYNGDLPALRGVAREGEPDHRLVARWQNKRLIVDGVVPHLELVLGKVEATIRHDSIRRSARGPRGGKTGGR